MIKINFNNFILLLSICSLLVSCKADKIGLEIYSSDLESAAKGEIVEIPIKSAFNLIGNDDDGSLKKATELIKNYLPKDSEMTQTKGSFGDVLNISSTIPLGTKKALDKYLKTNKRLATLLISKDTLTLITSSNLKPLNTQLQDINFMLSLNFPAKSTFFRIVNDQKAPIDVSATAVFSDNAPFLHFKKSVQKRKSVVLEYRGSEGSVYNQIPASVLIKR